jgi:hypothetical protein
VRKTRKTCVWRRAFESSCSTSRRSRRRRRAGAVCPAERCSASSPPRRYPGCRRPLSPPSRPRPAAHLRPSREVRASCPLRYVHGSQSRDSRRPGQP